MRISGLSSANDSHRRIGFAAGIDWPLLFAVGVALAMGFFALYSASDGGVYFWRQLNFAAAAILLMFAIGLIRLKYVEYAAPLIYGITLAALLFVHFFGAEINNAKRWLQVGGYRLQPSEFMKIAAPLALAWFYARFENPRWPHHCIAAAILAMPVLLVLNQPDLGTAVLLAAAGFFVIFLAGLNWRLIAGLFIAALASAPVGWIYLLKDYQKTRILTLFDPDRDPLGSGYHTIQSTIAVGSGGLWGKGWQQGTQAQLGFLPERHTDFIFAVFAEEFGFVGCLVFLAAALMIVMRGFSLAWGSPDSFGRLAAGSLALAFFAGLFVNLGMVSGLLPVVGSPLPLMSYGGTAMMSAFLGFGVLLAVSRASGKSR